MAEEAGKKDDDKVDFTPEGETLGYISLDQARVLAMEHARDNTGFYGRRYARRPLFWEVVSQEETEDYYEITLTYRPAQRFDGQPGTELFTIDKEGPIRLRQIVTGPEEKRSRWPIIASAVGVTAVGAVVGALFATGVLPPSSQDGGGDTTTPTHVWVVPDAPAKLVSPQQDVTIDLGAGSVPGPAQLSYQRVPPEQVPSLPPGYLAPLRAFDLSLTGDQEADPAPSLLRPITITVALTGRDRDLAALIESNVVIQHFGDDAKQWTPLPTTVDFDSLTAQARVDSLSVFALTIKRTESRAPADPMAPEPNYTLAVSAAPTNGGSINGGGEYADGTQVTVTASANSDWQFSGWSGACSGAASCVVTMDSNKAVTASFSQQRFTLTTSMNPARGGSVTGGGAYLSRVPVDVVATANPGWTFGGWSGACTGDASCVVTMDSHQTVTARFSQQRYTLTTKVTPARGGKVTGGGSYVAGTTVTVTASPAQGYGFGGWSGACSGGRSCSITMDSNKTAAASFSQQRFTLTTNVDPSIGGSVTGGGVYGAGTQVAVSATPNSGWAFSGWTGACSGSGVCLVNLDTNKTVIASFSQQQRTLTVQASPASGGSVTGGGVYGAGTQVAVSATPNSGWAFSGWTGACSGSGVCLVNLDTNKTVIASFSRQLYTLTTQANPGSGGSVTGGGLYGAGTQLTVIATPNSGWEFSGWSGACAGTGSCVVNLDSSETVTANFIQVQYYTLTASAEPPNGGSLTGGGSYAAGTQVTVTATPNSGWVFDFWLEPPTCSGTGACVVTMDSDKTVTADFNQQLFTLTADANPSTGGTVSGGGTYSPGTQATVTATPNSGYTFTGWSGACSGTGSCLVTMDSNKTVTANFTQQFTLTTVAEPSTGGTVSPAGVSSYDSGSQVTVTATAAGGYSFDKWTGACTGTGPCIVTMDSNKTVIASFSLFPIPGQVTFDRYTDGSPITSDVILTGTEFQAQGILLAAAPESSYCSDAKVAAVRMAGTYDKADNFLTTARPGAVNSCNTILVEIQFINPARQVTLSFSGATVTYTMKVYDSGGSLLGTVQQGAVVGSGTFQISFSSGSANISRVTFGKQTAVTAVSQINFQE